MKKAFSILLFAVAAVEFGFFLLVMEPEYRS